MDPPGYDPRPCLLAEARRCRGRAKFADPLEAATLIEVAQVFERIAAEIESALEVPILQMG